MGARVTMLQTNFSAGELSPRLKGRVDIARYQNGAAIFENAIPLVHGGALGRMGTIYAAAAKFADKKSRLVPFIFNRTQAYMLEFGHHYLRVFKDGGQVLADDAPYEISTPYSEDMIWDIDYVQGADTMFLAHPDVPIQSLVRFDHANWRLTGAAFIVEPFDELGHAFAVELTLSAATVGTGRTATAASPIWLQGDIGRTLTFSTGIATISGFSSSTVVTVDISASFPSPTLTASTYRLQDTPQAAITPTAETGSWSGVAPDADLHLSSAAVGTGRSFSTTTHAAPPLDLPVSVFTNDDVGGEVHCQGGIAIITDVNHNIDGITSAICEIKSVFPAADFDSGLWALEHRPQFVTASDDKHLVGESIALQSDTPAFREADVGSFIEFNGGLVKITAVTDATHITAVVLEDVTSGVTAAAGAWILEQSQWQPEFGYPRTVSLFEQRLIAAGSTQFPQTIWGSKTGQYYNFTVGTDDDSAFAFTIASDQINPIINISAGKVMVALTYGGEFSIYGGVEKPITPTNVQIKPQSEHGCAGVRPVQIGAELCFIQRSGRKLRTMAYRFDTDSYESPDITVLSEHITESGIVDMAYQQEPESVAWLVRGDGKLATLTISRDQDVIAWARQVTDGFVESVAAIPTASGDQVWIVVRRHINGADLRYVEFFDGWESPVLLDSCLKGSDPSGATLWSGLDHLEGEQVTVKADGTLLDVYTVSGGQITLSRAAKAVEIGLPYTMTLALLPPEIGTGAGSAQGNAMGSFEISVRLLSSIGGKINNQTLPGRKLDSAQLDQPPPLYSGLQRIENLGWERGEDPIVITQDQPYPIQIQQVIRKIVASD